MGNSNEYPQHMFIYLEIWTVIPVLSTNTHIICFPVSRWIGVWIFSYLSDAPGIDPGPERLMIKGPGEMHLNLFIHAISHKFGPSGSQFPIKNFKSHRISDHLTTHFMKK